MTPFARAALLQQHAQEAESLQSSAALRGVRGQSEIGGLAELVQGLVDSGVVLGCQVSVMQHGRQIVDIAAGSRDHYTLAPVRADSLFNSFSVSKAVAAAALHLLAMRGIVDFDAPVQRYWPVLTQSPRRS